MARVDSRPWESRPDVHESNHDVTCPHVRRGSANPEVTSCHPGDIGGAILRFRPSHDPSPVPSPVPAHDHSIPRVFAPLEPDRLRAARPRPPCVRRVRRCVEWERHARSRRRRAATAAAASGHGTGRGASTAVAATPSPAGSDHTRPTRATPAGWGAWLFDNGFTAGSQDRRTVFRRRRRRAPRVEDTRLPPSRHVVVARRRSTHTPP